MWQPVRRPSHKKSQNVPNFGMKCSKPLRFLGLRPDPTGEFTTLPRPLIARSFLLSQSQLLGFGARNLTYSHILMAPLLLSPFFFFQPSLLHSWIRTPPL